MLLAAALVAGCATAPPPEQAPPRPGCARPTDEVREIVLDPAIHLQVTVLLTGAGSRGVAIFPQSDGDLCQFADLAHHLADAGYRVATFAPWSSPYDRPVAATYAALTAAGAQRVVLLGASQGAALALATAPALDPRPAGVVSLSAVTPHPGADRGVRRPRPVHVSDRGPDRPVPQAGRPGCGWMCPGRSVSVLV